MFDVPFGISGGGAAKNSLVVGASEVEGSKEGLRFVHMIVLNIVFVQFSI